MKPFLDSKFEIVTRREFQKQVASGADFIAIPDLHGSYRELIEAIPLVRDFKLAPVFLGDYVDTRGDAANSSILTLEVCMRIRSEFERAVFLQGNHELEMIRNLTEGNLRDLPSLGSKRLAIEEYIEVFGEVPERHLEFLAALKTYHESGRFLFVHGGIGDRYAEAPIESIPAEHLSWEYGVSRRYRGKLVVCGHNLVEEPLLETRSLSIETGVWAPRGYLTLAFLSENPKKSAFPGFIRLKLNEAPEFIVVRDHNRRRAFDPI